MTGGPLAGGPAEVSAAGIRSLVRGGDDDAAAAAAGRLIEASFGLPVAGVELTVDEYSLNSVSGRVRFADGHAEFFKFHSEDGEERNVAEYYRARLLADAGLPVDVPLRVATQPGRQIALYRLRTEPRLADVCYEAERSDGAAARLSPGLESARRALDTAICSVMLRTLRPPVPSSASASIHQLFHHRLTGDGGFPGGRYRAWYLDDPEFEKVADRRFRLNGITYDLTPRQLASRAASLLDPSALAAQPVITAHGDDHQGNVWVLPGPQLRLFDPAFASDDIPALLAPVKATYHNVFAHPFWLYHPAQAAGRITAPAGAGDNVVSVRADLPLAPLRRQIMDSIAELVWAPLLATLARRGELPAGWRAIVRAALSCCPLLVTNLMARSRPEPLRLFGLAQAVAAGSEPLDGEDHLSRMLDAVTPA